MLRPWENLGSHSGFVEQPILFFFFVYLFLTIYHLVKIYWLLDETYGLHLQDQAVQLFTILHGLTHQKIQVLLLQDQ